MEACVNSKEPLDEWQFREQTHEDAHSKHTTDEGGEKDEGDKIQQGHLFIQQRFDATQDPNDPSRVQKVDVQFKALHGYLKVRIIKNQETLFLCQVGHFIREEGTNRFVRVLGGEVECGIVVHRHRRGPGTRRRRVRLESRAHRVMTEEVGSKLRKGSFLVLGAEGGQWWRRFANGRVRRCRPLVLTSIQKQLSGYFFGAG